MSPLEEAFHDFADSNPHAEVGYDCFVGGWEARGDFDLDRAAALYESTLAEASEERERTRVYWQTKVASVEAERDALIQRLATVAYERESFKRMRDELAGRLAAGQV